MIFWNFRQYSAEERIGGGRGEVRGEGRSEIDRGERRGEGRERREEKRGGRNATYMEEPPLSVRDLVCACCVCPKVTRILWRILGDTYHQEHKVKFRLMWVVRKMRRYLFKVRHIVDFGTCHVCQYVITAEISQSDGICTHMKHLAWNSRDLVQGARLDWNHGPRTTKPAWRLFMMLLGVITFQEAKLLNDTRL